jgi:hypothetical protein
MTLQEFIKWVLIGLAVGLGFAVCTWLLAQI